MIEYITKKQVFDEISDCLMDTLNKEGFIYKKSKGEFKKVSANSLSILSIGVVNFWPLKQELNFPVSIINGTINQHAKEIVPDFSESNITVYEWIALPNSNELGYRELYTLQDLQNAKAQVFDVIVAKAMDFFNHFSNFKSIATYYKSVCDNHKNVENYVKLLISLKLSEPNYYHKAKYDILLDAKTYDIDTEVMEECIKYLDQLSDAIV